MLEIIIPATESLEMWDETKQEFVTSVGAKEQKLQLEHSLFSISKWESKWCKPFLKKDNKSREEDLDYIRCMTLTPNVDPMVYKNLTNENFLQINKYIDSPETATTFREGKQGSGKGEQLTSELIYYYMISFNIPFECQKWHLNRLMTLIKICNIKNGPTKKMSKRDIMRQNASLNAARRNQLNTKG